MKNYLLTLPLVLLSATASFAQTTPETAINAQAGKNAFTVEGSDAKTVYWKYTPEKNCLATVKTLTGDYSSAAPNVGNTFTTDEDTKTTQLVSLKGASIGYPNYIYPMEKGKTYYFSITSVGEVGFQLSTEDADDVSGGVSQDKPLQVKDDTSFFLGDATSTSYSSYNVYTTYTAKENGQLVFSSTSYYSAVVNGNSVYADYSNNKYNYKMSIEAGKTYNVTFSIGQPLMMSATVSHPTPGSLEMPFEAKDGENVVPADFGEYYYTYTPSKPGFIVVNSNESLRGGQVKVFDSKYGLGSNLPASTSETGSFNTRAELANANMTCYILVSKGFKTAGEQKFTISMEEYKQGELESNPIVITTLPATETLGAAKGTFYYQFDVPANTNKFLVVKASKKVTSADTELTVYPAGSSYLKQTGTDYVEYNLSSSYETSYIIMWDADEDEPIQFTVDYKDIQKGDMLTNPADAVAGENTVATDGTKYYVYKATRKGKLTVECDDPNMEVSFPMTQDTYASEYEAIVNGRNFSVKAEKDKKYFIKIQNCVAGAKFNIVEGDFAQGETSDYPVVVDADKYVIGKDQNYLWLKYTAKKDCQLTIDCDVDFDDNSFVYFGKDANSMTGMVSSVGSGSSYTSMFHGTVILSAGEAIYVNLKLKGNVEGKSVTFVENEIPVGFRANNPFVLEVGQTIDLPEGTSLWAKARLTKGDNVFVTHSYVDVYYYTSLEDALSGNNRQTVNFNTEYNSETYEPTNTFTKNVEEAQDIYFMFQRIYSPITFQFVSDGTTTGIDGINADNNVKAEVFTLNGVKVGESINGLNRGMYIVRQNGKAKKIVIK